MDRLFGTLALIFASLATGYALRQAVLHDRIHRLNSDSLAILCRRMQRLGLFVFIPFSAMLSLWGMQHPDAKLMVLPLLGLVSWITGGVLGICLAKILHLDRLQTGSLFCCGTLSNIGGVGSLICVFFFGESAIALIMLYRLCEEMLFFGIVMPVARWYGKKSDQKLRPDPLLAVVFAAILGGMLLNYAGIIRPSLCAPVASASMIAGTVLLLVSIGMGLRFSRLAAYQREWLGVACIKFLAVPCIVTGFAWIFGLGTFDNGLPLKTVAVVSAMPVAMNALVPPSFYGLDIDLANACWIFTTLALIVVIPALLVITPAL